MISHAQHTTVVCWGGGLNKYQTQPSINSVRFVPRPAARCAPGKPGVGCRRMGEMSRLSFLTSLPSCFLLRFLPHAPSERGRVLPSPLPLFPISSPSPLPLPSLPSQASLSAAGSAPSTPKPVSEEQWNISGPLRLARAHIVIVSHGGWGRSCSVISKACPSPGRKSSQVQQGCNYFLFQMPEGTLCTVGSRLRSSASGRVVGERERRRPRSLGRQGRQATETSSLLLMHAGRSGRCGGGVLMPS